MTGQTEFTLPEIARLMREPQHRLIHLCEKGAIVPDVQDARGRGASRRFSRRNVLEFAIALELRQMMLPVAAAAAVIHVLRAFERNVDRELGSFSLPDSLQVPDAPDIRLVLSDGRLLYFTLARAGSVPKVFGGIDIASMTSGRNSKGPSVIREITTRRGGKSDRGDFGALEGSRHARVEVSITRIARDLPLN
jgi:hypothetical protein